MPWFIWMSFLTVPVLVGVACTLALNRAHDSKAIDIVFLAAGVWLFVAFSAKKRLQEWRPRYWVGRWLKLCVLAPLLVLFALSVSHDPGIQQLADARQRACEGPDPYGRAAAAPSRRALTWAETRELLARLQPLAIDYVLKLFTALPLAWWFFAFGIGLWKGR